MNTGRSQLVRINQCMSAWLAAASDSARRPARRCSFSVVRLLTYFPSLGSSLKSTDALRRCECSSSHCKCFELYRRGGTSRLSSFIIVFRSVHRVMLQAEGCIAVLMRTRYATFLFFKDYVSQLVSSHHEHTTNLATRVSRRPVLDCGTIFHPDCGSRDFPSILSDDL